MTVDPHRARAKSIVGGMTRSFIETQRPIGELHDAMIAEIAAALRAAAEEMRTGVLAVLSDAPFCVRSCGCSIDFEKAIRSLPPSAPEADPREDEYERNAVLGANLRAIVTEHRCFEVTWYGSQRAPEHCVVEYGCHVFTVRGADIDEAVARAAGLGGKE